MLFWNINLSFRADHQHFNIMRINAATSSATSLSRRVVLKKTCRALSINLAALTNCQDGTLSWLFRQPWIVPASLSIDRVNSSRSVKSSQRTIYVDSVFQLYPFRLDLFTTWGGSVCVIRYKVNDRKPLLLKTDRVSSSSGLTVLCTHTHTHRSLSVFVLGRRTAAKKIFISVDFHRLAAVQTSWVRVVALKKRRRRSQKGSWSLGLVIYRLFTTWDMPE